MGDIQFVDMVVDEIKSENGRTVIRANGQMYSFFQTKKDGQPSRAQSDFEQLGVTIGKNYSFGITENAKQMPDGKTITFKNIVLISESRNGQQQTPAPAQTPEQPTENIPDQTPPADIPEF